MLENRYGAAWIERRGRLLNLFYKVIQIFVKVVGFILKWD